MQRVSRLGAAVVAATALSVLIGWYTGLGILTILPSGQTTRPNAAIAFLVLAVGLAIGRRRVLIGAGSVAAAIAASALVELMVGVPRVLQVLLPGIDLQGRSPTMTPLTAGGLLLLGSAVAAGTLGGRPYARASALIVLGLSQISLMGHAFNVAALYTVGSSTAMAPSAAGCLAILALLVLAQHPSAGLVGLLRDRGSAGRLLRPLVPILLIGPPVVGGLCLWAEDRGWFAPRFGVVVLVISMTAVVGVCGLLVAAQLRKVDSQRDEAQRVLAETNDSLDTTIAERTRELADRESFTTAMLETVEVGIIWCDPDGLVYMRNQALRTMLGLGDEALGVQSADLASVMDMLDTAGNSLSVDGYPLNRTLRGEAVLEESMMLGPHGGPYVEVVATGSQIVADDGSVRGAVLVFSDVTAERSAARAMDEQRRALTEAQRLGQIGSFEVDLETDTWTYSEQMCELWGVAAGSMTSELGVSLIAAEDRERAVTFWLDACRVGGGHSQEFRVRRESDGAERVLRARIEVDLGPDGVPLRGRGTHLDITDLTAAEKAATRANAFLDAVLAATPDFTAVVDQATGAVVYVSRETDILGMKAEQIRALGPRGRTGLVHADDRAQLEEADAAAAELADGEVIALRYRAKHASGQWRWLSRRTTPFRRDASGAVVEVLCILRDIDDLMEAEDRLRHAALHDALTGLPNRALLVSRLEAALTRSAEDGREVAVLFCDLDGFKRVNDVAGHAAGDALLLEIAHRLRTTVREHDTVARIGGDEFVLVVEAGERADAPDGTGAPGVEVDRGRAVQVAARVAAALDRPTAVSGLDHGVTASIGITYAMRRSGATDGAVTAEQVLQEADSAMYLAKRRGKSRFEIFEHGTNTGLAERHRVEQVLRLALHLVASPVPDAAGPAVNAPTFSAAYQPVFDAGTGRLTGFEALARLTDSAGLPIAPDVFIPIAEETGVIHLLGRTILGLACSQLRAWRAEVPGLEKLTMAVNVSALQAQHASLHSLVHSALSANGLAPDDLVLELTETALLRLTELTIDALRTLRSEGVGISIDDFGVGYASLRYLATLPVSAIKIDRSFAVGLPHDEVSRKIVYAVAGLAEDMGLTCIVEGVETVEQRAALPSGVWIQGYLSGRPQPAEHTDVVALCVEGRPLHVAPSA